MSRLPNSALRRFAVLATAAVAGASLTMAATPATGASGTINYTCSALGGLAPGLKFTATGDTNAPAAMVIGRSSIPTLTTTITIDESTTGLLRDLGGADQVEGTGTVDTTVGGAAQKVSSTIAKTSVPASGRMSVLAKGRMKAIKATKVGSIVMTVRDFEAQLKLTKKDGTPAPIADVPIQCVQDARQKNVIDTIKVAKATSKTRTTLAWTAKTRTLTATAAVTPKATGKVTFVITKNGKKFKSVTTAVNSTSKAIAKLPRLAKGTYAVTAKYTGSAALNGSTAPKVSKKV